MFFFKSFIRGGQTSLHQVRMAKQLLKIMLVSSIIIVSSVSFIKTQRKIPPHQISTFIAYSFAKGFSVLGMENKEIPVSHFTGQRELYRSIDLINNPSVLVVKNRVFGVLIKNIFFSIKLFLFFFVIIGGYFVYRGNKFISMQHLRGSKLKDLKQITKEIIRYNRKKLFNGERKNRYKIPYKFYDYKIANVPYSSYSESLHTLITGTTGSGKTVIISDLLEQIKRNGDRAIVYDRMGTLVSHFYDEEKDTILNPLDDRSPYWSIFNEAESEIHFNTMASALIPHNQTQEPFWADAARIIFSEVCNVLHKRENATNDELIKAVLKTDIEKVSKILQEADTGSFIINKDSAKHALSVMSMLTTNIRSLKYLRKQQEEGIKNFSIRDWVHNENEKGFLFISSRADQHETLKPLISTWMEIAINSILSLKPNRSRKLWVIIDELPSLHYIPSLHAGLAESRQFGGAFVLGMQLMAQLRSIYGKDRAESTSGLCGTRVILASPDEETATWCSNNLGKMEVEEMKESISYGANEIRDGISMSKHEQIKHIVLASEIMNMKNLRAYVKPAEDFGVTYSKIKYKKREEVADSFVPNIEGSKQIRVDNEPTSFPPPSEPKEEDKITYINSKGDGYTGMMNNADYFGFDKKELLAYSVQTDHPEKDILKLNDGKETIKNLNTSKTKDKTIISTVSNKENVESKEKKPTEKLSVKNIDEDIEDINVLYNLYGGIIICYQSQTLNHQITQANIMLPVITT